MNFTKPVLITLYVIHVVLIIIVLTFAILSVTNDASKCKSKMNKDCYNTYNCEFNCNPVSLNVTGEDSDVSVYTCACYFTGGQGKTVLLFIIFGLTMLSFVGSIVSSINIGIFDCNSIKEYCSKSKKENKTTTNTTIETDNYYGLYGESYDNSSDNSLSTSSTYTY